MRCRMATETRVPPSAALPGGEAALLDQWRRNLSGVQGINLLETAVSRTRWICPPLGQILQS